jgi:ATP-dependent Clp protease adaptor protein ClpS
MTRRKKETDGDLATLTRPKTQQPKLYQVLLHNDDYTPMEFVVMILMEIFHKNYEEATYIMLRVHRKGLGHCGSFPHSIAEAKVAKVMDQARKHGHPLLCTMEPE